MRLNSIQKAEILAQLDRGVCGNHLAKEYNVSKSTISRLKKSKYDEMSNSEMSQPEADWNDIERDGDRNASDSDDNGENQSYNASNKDENEYDDTDNELSDGTSRKSSLSSERSVSESESEIESDSSKSADEDNDYQDDEEDPNEICEELRCVSHPNRSLKVMLQLISKLRRGGYVE